MSLDNYAAGFEYEGLPSVEVYQSYVRWCENNGYQPMNNSNFGKEVKRTFPSVERQLSQTAGRLTSIYAGIAVRGNPDVAQERFRSLMV